MTYKDSIERLTSKTRGIYDPYKEIFQLFLVPIVFSVIPIVYSNKAGLCAYVVCIMSVYWILQCVPIAVTSLLPTFLYPLMGIMSSEFVSGLYFNDNIMFIFGSLMIGIGIETSGLHQKLALRAVMLVGSQPRWLLLGVMSITAFLSIWISNTAVAAMMLPIVVSLVKNLAKLDPAFQEPKPAPKPMNIYATVKSIVSIADLVEKQDIESQRNTEGEIPQDLEEIKTNIDDIASADDTISQKDNKFDVFQSKAAKNLIKCFLLAISYSSLIGGSASLIGTTSNLFMKSYFEKEHPDGGMNFLTFIAFALPCSVVHLFSAWLILGAMYLPKEKFFDFKKLFNKIVKRKKKESPSEKQPDLLMELVKSKYEELGPYTWEQISIGSWFVVAVLLWLTRDLHFVPGWQALFTPGYITDTTTAIFVLFCVIAWPRNNIFRGNRYTPLILWNDVEKMFPWNVILLLGGSLAMAKGCEESGFSEWIGRSLEKILPADKYLVLIIMMIVSSLGTEFMSNISMISILLPILDQIAEDKQISYFFLLLPQAIAINLSYMFPSATPANAIVFGVGFIELKDMMLSGILIKIVGLGLAFVVSIVWLPVVFPFEYAEIVNVTSTVVSNTTKELLTTQLAF